MSGYTEVFAWGGDHFGQLGLGGKTSNKTYSSPRFCSFNITIREISCGEEHSGFISSTGHVYTMGSNADGRLGIGSRALRSSPSPCLVEDLSTANCVRISCGWGHTAVVTDAGQAYSWGYGEFGALGNGGIEHKWLPTPIALTRCTALDVSCGSRHTGIVVRDKSGNRSALFCGGGEAGQLGTGRREKELTPVLVEISEEVEQIACGVFHTAILGTRGSVFTMGGNSFGQLGLGNKKSQSRPEKVTHLDNIVVKKVRCSNFTAAISDKGQLFVWGSGVFGEYLVPHRWNLREQVVDIALGSGFGLAIDAGLAVFAWGGNSNGELGLDDYEPRSTPTLVTTLKGKSIKRIACGGNFCLGLGSDVFARSKTPERTRKVPQESKKGDEINQSVGKMRIEEVEKGTVQKKGLDEVEKLSFEVQQTYKSYEEIKKNFESLSEKYEVDKRSHLKYVEELNREIARYRQENEKYRGQLELDNREIRELSICVDELKRVNMDVSSEANMYKEELMRTKKSLDDTKYMARSEINKVEETREQDVLELRERLNDEGFRRKHIQGELEKANSIIYSYENTIKNFQKEINEISIEMQQNISKSENEKGKLLAQIEKLQKDVVEISRKAEFSGIEKEKVNKMLKGELENYFQENKELKFQLEIIKDQAQQRSIESSELVSQLNGLSAEKTSSEASLRQNLDAFAKENIELKRKVEALLLKTQHLERVQFDLSKAKTENSDMYKQLETLSIKTHNYEALQLELVRLRSENNECMKKLENYYSNAESSNTLIFELKQNMEGLNTELEQLLKENSQLKEKVDYLTNDKEKLSASLSAEIEQLASQKSDIMQKYDQYYIEKEKKTHTLSTELDRATKENYEQKRKIEVILSDLSQKETLIEQLTSQLTRLQHEYESLLSENRNSSTKLQTAFQDNSEIKHKLQQAIIDRDSTVDRLKSELETSFKEISNLTRQTELLKVENKTLSESLASVSAQAQSLSRDISSKEKDLCNRSAEVQKLLLELSAKDKDLLVRSSELKQLLSDLSSKDKDLSIRSTELKQLLSGQSSKENEIIQLHSIITNKEAELLRLQEQCRLLTIEKSDLAERVENLRHETERLRSALTEQEFAFGRLKEAQIAWESQNTELQTENSELKMEVEELEGKNRQLFENLERELAQRAKDYKERTMSMLSMPVRCSSPYMRPPTPGDPDRGRIGYNRTQTPVQGIGRTAQEDFKGNTAAKLLQTLEDSPNSRFSSKVTNKTPTKEDIRTRIASLMENRNRLECELRQLEE